MAGIIDPYVASGTVRPFAVAAERKIIQSRDGFLFLPRYDERTVPALDRVVVPPDAESGVSAYGASVRDLSQRQNAVVAHAAANAVYYSADPGDFAGAAWPIPQIVTFLTLSLCGAAFVYGLRRTPIRPALQMAPLDPAAAR
jgi:hypothetical protein